MKYKRFFCYICIMVMLITLGGRYTYVYADEELSVTELYALSAVLMDADTGRILFDKNGCERRANASTTKILTCILALECADITDRVTVSAYAAKMPDVQLNMNEGEEYYLGDLLHSLMLESHNDSAVAIAEHVGGSVEGFAAMMNEKAKEIGCHNTYFITPNGLDAKDEQGFHGTCARDLAQIMRYCIMKSPQKEEFLDITRTDSYTFSDVSGSRTFTCSNHNSFLNMMEGALTGKTGFTCDAGYCYVGALERDGRTYIVALLGCGWPNNKTYKWSDTKKLMKYGIDNYVTELLNGDKAELQINVVGGTKGDTLLQCSSEYSSNMLWSDKDEVRYEYIYPDTLTAPVYKDSIVGQVNVYVNGELFDVENIYAECDIEEETLGYDIKKVADIFLHGAY